MKHKFNTGEIGWHKEGEYTKILWTNFLESACGEGYGGSGMDCFEEAFLIGPSRLSRLLAETLISNGVIQLPEMPA